MPNSGHSRARTAPAHRHDGQSHGANHQDGSFPWLRAVGLGALAVALVWLVATRSLPAYFARTEPELALRLNANEPAALRRLAADKIAALRPPAAASEQHRIAPDATKVAEVRALLERAAVAAPLDSRGFAMMAELADITGDKARALALSKAAVRRSLRESDAVYRLLQAAFEAKDYAGTLAHADTLMRARPAASAAVAPYFARMAETPDARDALKKLLATNPPWRGHLFEHLQNSVTDARTPLDLYLAIKATPNPPTTRDLRNYFQLLFRHDLHQLAYYAWLQFLPPEQLARVGLLFNGNFAFEPSGLPFDWVIRAGSGATVQIRAEPDADKGRALEVELSSGQVQLGEVSQIVTLSPGRYALHGAYRGEISGRRGLRWRLTCAAGAAATLAETPMHLGSTPKWKDFEVPVTITADTCRAQKLQLVLDARSASEQIASGTVWYKNLEIRRLAIAP